MDHCTGPQRPNWWPLTACCLATFLLLIYTTVVTVSASAITAALDLSYVSTQWVIDAYTLVLAALLLAMGSVGDRFGHRRLFLIGLVLFTVGTASAAAAPGAAWLICSRAVQGVGGAAMFATIVALLSLGYQGVQRARAFATWGAVAGAGAAIGTIGGGVVTEFVSWRWLFILTLPLCGIALVLGVRSLPAERGSAARLDWAGAVLVTVIAAAVTYAAIESGEGGWLSAQTVAAMVVAAVAAIVFPMAERRAAQPILPPHLFATRAFGALGLCAFAYYFAAFAWLPEVSKWLQVTLGMTSSQAALVLTAQLVVFVAITLMLGGRLHAAPVSWVLGGGTAFTGLACLTAAGLWLRPDWTTVLIALVFTGVGAGVVTPILPVAAATSVPAQHAGTAGAAANSARQLGLTIGVALCGAVVAQAGPGGNGPTNGVAVALTMSGVVAVVAGAAGVYLLSSSRRGADQVMRTG